MNRKTELLSPAGDLERAKIALTYGADAIYLGAKAFSLRARASNFDIEDVSAIIDWAHQRNKKVYLVTNVICHNKMASAFIPFLKKILKNRPDGFICADPYIIDTIKTTDYQAEVHCSTQQSVANSYAAKFWKQHGVSRVVLAREVNYKDLKLICENLKNVVEVEYFIHGAVCIAYSGQCMMSNNYSLRDANVGGCAQSCRWVNTISEKNHKYSEYFSMSAKDMALIKHIPELLDLNIASFKIEGRMKSAHYVATIINSYRKAIDDYYSKKSNKVNKAIIDEVATAANRKTDDACFNGRPGKDQMLYHEVPSSVKQNFIFTISQIKKDGLEIIAKNFFKIGDTIEIFQPGFKKYEMQVKSILDNDGNHVEKINKPMEKYFIQLDGDLSQIESDAFGRLIKS